MCLRNGWGFFSKLQICAEINEFRHQYCRFFFYIIIVAESEPRRLCTTRLVSIDAHSVGDELIPRVLGLAHEVIGAHPLDAPEVAALAPERNRLHADALGVEVVRVTLLARQVLGAMPGYAEGTAADFSGTLETDMATSAKIHPLPPLGTQDESAWLVTNSRRTR